MNTTIVSEFPAYAWMDGSVIAWSKACLHVRTQGAFWGANVFEGVRGYWQAGAKGIRFFCLEEHLRRLRNSAKCLRMPVTTTDAKFHEALHVLVDANNFTEHVHAVIGLAYGMGVRCDSLGHTDTVHTHITAIEMPRSIQLQSGISAGTSSWRRISDESMPPRIKAGANYHNSRLAHQEATVAGFQTAIILNNKGTVAESPGACVAAVLGDTVVSPPATAGALPGITLGMVEKLTREQGLNFSRREIDRTEMYSADEVMLCGTLSEILPVTSIDHIQIGNGMPGPVVRRLQQQYDALVGIRIA